MFWKFANNYRYEADWDESVDLEQIVCPINPDDRRAGKRITDLSIVLPHRNVPDVVWVHYCVIQDRILRLFREAGFTGFDVLPVEARYEMSSDEPPKLWELRVTGWGGMAPPESGIQLVEHCPACGFLKYSGASHPELLVKESQWDGSDFFMIWPLPKFIFVTDRVADVVRNNQLTGVKLQRLSSLNLRGDETYSPGRLHHYMPEVRAHELGDQLGIY